MGNEGRFRLATAEFLGKVEARWGRALVEEEMEEILSGSCEAGAWWSATPGPGEACRLRELLARC